MFYWFVKMVLFLLERAARVLPNVTLCGETGEDWKWTNL